jgi:hypothetical protein
VSVVNGDRVVRIMGRSAGKNISFVTGMALVVLGAFELYVGLAQTGAGESAFVEIARSFMLLFPGYAFLAYSLHPNPRLTSHSVQTSSADEIRVTLPPAAMDPVPENVVVFPRRPGRGGPRTSGIRTYSK